MGNTELKALLKKVIEIAMPNLRKYYRIVRKAKVVATHASDGRYYCDVQPLRNDESVDESEPVLQRVEIPVIWAGSARGIICPPAVGSHCDLEYYDGDPSYPRISNFRWYENTAPAADVDELIIQQQNGVYVRICANKDVGVKTDGKVTVDAPESIFTGKVTVKGLFTYEAGLVGSGGSIPAQITGKLQATEIVTDSGVNMDSHTHSGVEPGSGTSGGPVV